MSAMKPVLVVLLSAVLFACGSSDPKTLISEGHAAQGKGDSKTAQARFTEALKGLKPGDAAYIDAKLGLVEALISNEPKKATAEFLALATEFPKQVGEKEFAFVGGQMVSAKKYMDAIDLVDAGIKRAGGNAPTLKAQMERIQKENVNDAAVNDKLKGLGYAK